MEAAFRLPASGVSGYAPRYTPDEWETIKPKIERLYVQEKQTLQQVAQLLKQEDGFTAT
jgi:hypothetical protein